MFYRFGRQIFSLYEKRPLLMNSLVGGGVYVAGEYTVQTQAKDVRFFDVDNWKKLAEVGALGSVENGVVMLKWYGVLNKYVGSGVATSTVLLKCLLDQIFFATQQDFMFLGLCAWSDTEALSEAIQEVKDTFITTWIVDCSLWPVVNFVGFAFVPYILQPTYMAFVSYFWQLYLSTSAAGRKDSELSDQELQALFKELDTDSSNFIDADELRSYFRRRNIKVTSEEVRQMIADADHMGRELRYQELRAAGLLDKMPEPDDGLVSFEEFKELATQGSKFQLKSSALWASVRQDILLTKGVKHAMKRLEGVQRQREEVQLVRKAVIEQVTAPPSIQDKSEEAPVPLINYLLGEPAPQKQEKKEIKEINAPAAKVPSQAALDEMLPMSEKHLQVEREVREKALAVNRAAAIEKATVGSCVLVGAVILRKIIFKV